MLAVWTGAAAIPFATHLQVGRGQQGSSLRSAPSAEV